MPVPIQRPPMLDRTDLESWQQRNLVSNGAHSTRNVHNQSILRIQTLSKTIIAAMHAYENGAVLDEEQLLFLAGEQVANFEEDVDDLALNVNHIFEADQCDAFDSDVDEAPTNRPCSCTREAKHYVEDNEEHVVQSNVSSIRNDALMSILDEMHEQGVQKRKIDEQMRIIISDRNQKETSLKSELHSAQLQLRSTLNHHKIVREEAIILKKDFKQKEDKFLEEFLDIKRLKEKVEDRLYKQDQSIQTVHMIYKPKSFYDEKNKVAICYKNPLYLTRTKQVQPTLYNGHVLVMSNHARPVVYDSEDTRDMAEITRKRIMEKMKSPLCVENKVRIAPRLLEGKPSCNLCSTKKSNPRADILVHR
ncbi:hypothetical protein Tco_0932283 [Tanacetum coccineum]